MLAPVIGLLQSLWWIFQTVLSNWPFRYISRYGSRFVSLTTYSNTVQAVLFQTKERKRVIDRGKETHQANQFEPNFTYDNSYHLKNSTSDRWTSKANPMRFTNKKWQNNYIFLFAWMLYETITKTKAAIVSNVFVSIKTKKKRGKTSIVTKSTTTF